MYWLLYDISDNRRRVKLAQLCKDYGFVRMQKSCFFGRVNKITLNRFERELERMADSNDIIYLIPIAENSLKQMRIWGEKGEMFKEDDICFL